MTLLGTLKRKLFPLHGLWQIRFLVPTLPSLLWDFAFVSFARRLCSAPMRVGAEVPPTPQHQVWPHRGCGVGLHGGALGVLPTGAGGSMGPGGPWVLEAPLLASPIDKKQESVLSVVSL